MSRVVTTTDRAGDPVRTCLGCRRRRPATELVRVTRTADGYAVGGPSRGRGAWLCRGVDGLGVAASCLDAAVRGHRFGRAWRVPLGADDEVAIRAAIEAAIGVANDAAARRDPR